MAYFVHRVVNIRNMCRLCLLVSKLLPPTALAAMSYS